MQGQAKALVELAKSEKLVGQQQEPAVQPASPQPPVQQQAPVQPATQEEQADAPIEDATRKFDFGELKFGADYDPKEVK